MNIFCKFPPIYTLLVGAGGGFEKKQGKVSGAIVGKVAKKLKEGWMNLCHHIYPFNYFNRLDRLQPATPRRLWTSTRAWRTPARWWTSRRPARSSSSSCAQTWRTTLPRSQKPCYSGIFKVHVSQVFLIWERVGGGQGVLKSSNSVLERTENIRNHIVNREEWFLCGGGVGGGGIYLKTNAFICDIIFLSPPPFRELFSLNNFFHVQEHTPSP